MGISQRKNIESNKKPQRLTDRIDIAEIIKWKNRLNICMKTLYPLDKRAEDIIKNIRAYISDADYFTYKKKDYVLGFEAIIWAWAWLEIGKHIGILDYLDYDKYKKREIDLKNIRGIIFDIDGVFFRGNTPISNAIKSLQYFIENFKIIFLTNNSTVSPEKISQKFRKAGIRISPDLVLTSAEATAIYCQKNRIQRVYPIGEPTLIEELKKMGIELRNHDVDAVVVGLKRDITYKHISSAQREILNGAKFIATNTDPTLPVEDGFLPGAGAIISAISTATEKKPLVIGKPYKPVMDISLERLSLKPDNILIVGDRVSTDILAGKSIAATTCLVSTGVKNNNAMIEFADIRADSLKQLKNMFISSK